MSMPRRLPSSLLTLSLSLTLTACGGDPGGPAGAGGLYAAVAAGDGFTCALTADGRAWCWGQALFGQLGSGGTDRQSAPVPVAGDRRFRVIAAGSDHACGIAQDSTAWCWGLNDFAELGASTSFCNQSFRFVSCASAPIAVAGGQRFDSILVGGYATCGLVRGGGTAVAPYAAWCWGWNTHGEVGSDTAGAIVRRPAPVSGGRSFAAMSLDLFHACGVDGAGSLFCWGSNTHGQLAADTVRVPRCSHGPARNQFCAPAPVVAAVGYAVSVSAGSTHTCLLDLGGRAACWGSNQYGVLGVTGAAGGAVPVEVAGGLAFRSITAGHDHTCGLTAAGETWCWGLNGMGQLGSPPGGEACPAFGSAQPCRTVPTRVAAPAFVRISAGSEHTCGLTADGAIWCWGRGIEGQLGDGRSATSDAPVRVASAG